MNSVTASFNTTMAQMVEMSQRKNPGVPPSVASPLAQAMRSVRSDGLRYRGKLLNCVTR